MAKLQRGLIILILIIPCVLFVPLCRAKADDPLPPHEEVQQDILKRTEEMPMIIYAGGVILVFLALFIYVLRIMLHKI